VFVCDVRAEAEETVEYRSCNTPQQNRMAALRYMRFKVGLI